MSEETGGLDEESQVVCLRCCHVNEQSQSRCSNCKAPLGAFAASAPWEMLAATGDAYPPAANPKIKPIVFWGAWLYFAPSVVAAIWLTATFSESPAAFAPAALYGVLSVWALWSVSKRYFAKPPNTPPSGEGDH